MGGGRGQGCSRSLQALVRALLETAEFSTKTHGQGASLLHTGISPGIILGALLEGLLGQGGSGSLAGRGRLCAQVPSLPSELGGGCDWHTDIEEKGVRMKLTVIDTRGSGPHQQ